MKQIFIGRRNGKSGKCAEAIIKNAMHVDYIRFQREKALRHRIMREIEERQNEQKSKETEVGTRVDAMLLK